MIEGGLGRETPESNRSRHLRWNLRLYGGAFRIILPPVIAVPAAPILNSLL
jgi:hypothetical protein